MNSTISELGGDLKPLSVKDFTERLLQHNYPRLFLSLSQIEMILRSLRQGMDISMLQSVLQKMNEEMNEIYRKEKVLLFPLLLDLEATQRTAESCMPFKNVKYHYTCLVSTIQQFKALLKQR